MIICDMTSIELLYKLLLSAETLALLMLSVVIHLLYPELHNGQLQLLFI